MVLTQESRFGRYRAGSRSLTGRGTRGYVAYDFVDKRLVFLKDAWRLGDPDVPSEFAIYETLQKNKVSNIATVICGETCRREGARRHTHHFTLSS